MTKWSNWKKSKHKFHLNYNDSNILIIDLYLKKNLRAIDIERARQAELKRQLDMVAKGALVHSV